MTNYFNNKTILVTGGAGFIGSNFILHWLKSNKESRIINLDLLTYAGALQNLSTLDIDSKQRYFFAQGDISDQALTTNLMEKYNIDAIINFAAESHVDRSINSPTPFIHTNVNGTYNLLETAKNYWQNLPSQRKEKFRFLHISTDEVYGSLEPHEAAFTEESQYKPNSPYAASKAASDHLVRAYYHTYKLPSITTNCSNNYGPHQFPEKLIPLTITNAIKGKPIPIYGNGTNVRDWLFVQDHCLALDRVLQAGKIGEIYNIGGNNERRNIEVVGMICDILDKLVPPKKRSIKHYETEENLESYHQLIIFVEDRKGHDKRYAINTDKILRELRWLPNTDFEYGLTETIKWYAKDILSL